MWWSRGSRGGRCQGNAAIGSGKACLAARLRRRGEVAKETRASALCDELINNAWRPTHERFNDKTINGSLKKVAEWCARQE
jgi:hypothetical protein